ncbi:MAG: DUF6036 family nucleotidyltransferase [Solirubrobacteraceae bacterium]
MRADADKARIDRLLTELGKHGRGGDRIYVAGGTSAVEVGWREFTQDVDIRIESATDEPLLRAIASLKERLDVNVELASPLDFLPAPPNWADRSPFIARFGAVDVYHVDFALQALAKLERGLDRDLRDLAAMLDLKLTSREAIRDTFESIEPELYRFPAIDAEELRSLVQAFTALRGA